MKVYRIESNFSFLHTKQSGIGPYGAISSVKDKNNAIKDFLKQFKIFNYSPDISSSNDNPTPSDDGFLNKMSKDMYFAFSKIEQIRKWFNNYDLRKLSKCGFYISIYETEQYVEGGSQTIFNKKESRLIDFLAIEEII